MSCQQLCPIVWNGESDISSYLIDEFSEFYWFNNNNNDVVYAVENETRSESKVDLEAKHPSRKDITKRLFVKEGVLEYKYRRRVSQFPRILKRDFRRQIPQMYINVLNACDHKLLERFIHQFFHDNCVFKFKYFESNISFLESIGRDYLIKHSLLTILRFPDITFQLHDAAIIRTLQSEHCKLNIYFTTSGSKVQKYGEDQSIMNVLIQFLRERATIINGYDFENYDSFVYKAHLSLLLDENGHIYEFCVM